jgi:hypothetical protein
MTFAIDPSGFNIEVKIGVDGEDIPLWVRNDEQAGTEQASLGSAEATLRDLPIVESVNMELSLGLSVKTTIQLGAPYDLGIHILNSSLLRIGNIYKVRIGYPNINRYTGWFETVGTKPNVNIDPATGLAVTLNGHGGGFASSRGASPVQTTGSIQQAIRDLADVHGWAVSIPDPDGSESDDPLYKERNFTQEMRSNWAQIQYLARTAQCDAYLGPSAEGEGTANKETLYIVRRSTMLRGRGLESQSGPIYTFVMRGRTDFKRFFPILRYESEFENIWLPRAATRTSSADIDPDTGEEVSVEATPESSDAPAVGGEVVPGSQGETEDGVRASMVSPQDDDPRGAGSTGEHLYVSLRDPRTPENSVNSHQFEAQVRGSVQCRITSFAIPELWPSTLVRVYGVGHFSGLYALESMIHNANSQEWTIEMKLIANALSREFLRSGLAQVPPNTNDQGPDAQIDDDDPTSGPGTTERTAETP